MNLNEDDKILFEKVKKTFKIGSLKELAKILNYAETTANNWYKDGFTEIVKLKINEKLDAYSINTTQISIKTEHIIKIPKLSAKVSAGYSIQAIDSIEKIGELILDISIFKTKPPKNIFAMQVDGYSMVPMIFPDSWVIFDNCKQFQGDGLYIINWDDCLMVKQVSATPKKGFIKIISANKDKR